MNKRGRVTSLVGLLGILLAATALLAQEVVKSRDGRQVFLKFKPDVTEIARETLQVSNEAGGINTVWWLPEEFWKAALAANPNPTPPQTKIFVQEMFLKVVHPYFIVGVSSGKVGPFGAITYRTEAEVRGLVQLKENEGSIYEPFPEDKLDSSMLALLDAMKPTLAKTGGASGENIHFYVFPGSENDGARICDPRKEGTCEVDLGERAFKWRLPLGSLLPKQKCPVCGETFSGAYKFCPYDGTKLVANLAGTVMVPTSPATVPSLTPGQAIQQSLQAAASGGYHPESGAGGGSDSSLEFNNQHSNVSTEMPTILSDTRGVDFGPYLSRIIPIVRQKWIAVIPESARLGEKGRVGVVLEILKDGSVPQERMVASSGSDPLDRAAFNGIHDSAPFPSLPAEFTGNHLVLQFIFLYNLAPPKDKACSVAQTPLPTSPSPSSAKRVYSVFDAPTPGGDISAPIPIYKPEPAYTDEARKAKYEGTVVLWIVVDASGAVTDCRVVKPLGLGLDENAVETVKTWKFKPALKNGTPVPVRVMVQVGFQL